jgi:flagellar basal body L-ring protein FlgH
MKKLYILCIAICITYIANAQQSTPYSEKDYARNPVWIEMIKDTTANFFEVEKAFNIYFQHHEKPEGENDVIGEHEEREKNPSKKEQRKMQQENHMKMEVKKYERWHDRMLPYVQPDGRILTPSERLQLWRDQQKASNK